MESIKWATEVATPIDLVFVAMVWATVAFESLNTPISMVN